MADNIGGHEIWVEVDNTPPELSVNELTDNPTLDEPQYRINGSITSHSGAFEYTTNVTEGTNTNTVTATDAAGNTATWTKIRMVLKQIGTEISGYAMSGMKKALL